MADELVMTDAAVKQRQLDQQKELKDRESAERAEAREHARNMQMMQLDRLTRQNAMDRAIGMRGAEAAAADPEGTVTLAIRVEQYLKTGA